MSEKNNANETYIQPDLLEIGLLAIARVIGKYKKVLITAFLMGGIAGGMASFLFPKEYMSSTQLLPELKVTVNEKGVSSLASLAGLSFYTKSERDAFRPDLYPNVVRSIPAIVHLLRKPVETSDKKKYPSLIKYFEEQNNVVTPPGDLLNANLTTKVWHFNKEENALIQNIRGRITINYDKVSGIIIMQSEMLDPLVSALTLSYAVDYLSQFVATYRKDKKKEYRLFIERRLTEVEDRLLVSERALQVYRDANRNIVSNVGQARGQKLESDFNLLRSLRDDLRTQKEKAITKEEEGEVVIKVINPPSVPVENSSPKRVFYVLGGSIIAVFGSIFLFLIPWRRFLTKTL